MDIILLRYFENVTPKELKAFIYIVFNKTTGKYEVKVKRDKPYELCPCEKLIYQLVHVTVGKTPNTLLIEAKDIGEKYLQEIIPLL